MNGRKLKLRLPLLLALLLLVYTVHHCLPLVEHPSSYTSSKQPVIIDTDIGSYLDDSFAIVYAAQSPELDIKLIVTCTDDTTARAKIAAKLLRILGRDDIPIGIGIKNGNKTFHYLFEWAGNENLSEYRGGVFEDGVGKMGEILSNSDRVVDIIAIGPMTNFPQLFHRYPGSVKKARVRAMAGSIYVGYNSSKVPAPEYNVAICPWCMEILLSSGCNLTITPLDTCGTIALDAGEIQVLLESGNNPSLAVASTLLYYCTSVDKQDVEDTCYLTVGTPVLYDVVAVLLALPRISAEYLVYANMKLAVNGTDFTVVDEVKGVSTSVALYWSKDQGEKRFAEALAKNCTL